MTAASRTWFVIVVLALPAGVRAESADEGNPAAERAGDVMQVGIPLFALGLTFLFDGEGEADDSTARFTGANASPGAGWARMNGSPRHDLMLAIGRTELATYSLKYSIDAERPDGTGQSFPSGHTSMAFAGAEFIRKEYGWGLGLPSYLAAGYVGWSRVETRNHWTRDVLAGAAIGIFSNHDALDFTLPWGQLTVAPSLIAMPASTAFDPPDPMAQGLLEAPASAFVPGLSFEFRF